MFPEGIHPPLVIFSRAHRRADHQSAVAAHAGAAGLRQPALVPEQLPGGQPHLRAASAWWEGLRCVYSHGVKEQEQCGMRIQKRTRLPCLSTIGIASQLLLFNRLRASSVLVLSVAVSMSLKVQQHITHCSRLLILFPGHMNKVWICGALRTHLTITSSRLVCLSTTKSRSLDDTIPISLPPTAPVSVMMALLAPLRACTTGNMAWLPELMQRASIYTVDGVDSIGYLRCFKILHCVCWLQHHRVHYKPGSMPLDKLGLSNLLFQGHVAMDEPQAAHLRHESLFMPSSEVLAASPSGSTAFP